LNSWKSDRVGNGESPGKKSPKKEVSVALCEPLAEQLLRQAIHRLGEKEPPKEVAEGAIQCQERLGGLLKHNYRRAV